MNDPLILNPHITSLPLKKPYKHFQFAFRISFSVLITHSVFKPNIKYSTHLLHTFMHSHIMIFLFLTKNIVHSFKFFSTFFFQKLLFLLHGLLFFLIAIHPPNQLINTSGRSLFFLFSYLGLECFAFVFYVAALQFSPLVPNLHLGCFPQGLNWCLKTNPNPVHMLAL